MKILRKIVLCLSIALLMENSMAAGIKISALPAAGALTGTEAVPVVQGTTTVQTTAQAIANLSTAGVTQTSGTFTVTWSGGCSNAPTGTFTYVQTGNVVTLLATTDVACTSNATTFQTNIGDQPAAIRPVRQTNLKYTDLEIAGVATDACISLSSNGQIQFHTGVACGTNPGNVAKNITAASQTPLSYTLN